jgi:hypothetical protein
MAERGHRAASCGQIPQAVGTDQLHGQPREEERLGISAKSRQPIGLQEAIRGGEVTHLRGQVVICEDRDRHHPEPLEGHGREAGLLGGQAVFLFE